VPLCAEVFFDAPSSLVPPTQDVTSPPSPPPPPPPPLPPLTPATPGTTPEAWTPEPTSVDEREVYFDAHEEASCHDTVASPCSTPATALPQSLQAAQSTPAQSISAVGLAPTPTTPAATPDAQLFFTPASQVGEPLAAQADWSLSATPASTTPALSGVFSFSEPAPPPSTGPGSCAQELQYRGTPDAAAYGLVVHNADLLEASTPSQQAEQAAQAASTLQPFPAVEAVMDERLELLESDHSSTHLGACDVAAADDASPRDVAAPSPASETPRAVQLLHDAPAEEVEDAEDVDCHVEFVLHLLLDDIATEEVLQGAVPHRAPAEPEPMPAPPPPPPQALSPVAPSPPSAVHVCSMDARTLRDYVTPCTVLHVLRCASELHAGAPCAARAAAVELLQRRFGECVLASAGAGEAALRAALADDRQWAVIQTDSVAEARAKGVAKTSGTVLEKEAPAGGYEALARPGAAGELTYPLTCLVSTVAWPPDVDPAARELSLYDDEFLALFGCDKAAWAKLPAWKRAGTRKKHDLF